MLDAPWAAVPPLDAATDAARTTFTAAGVPPAIADVFVRRGYSSPAAASAHLKAPLGSLLIPPDRLPDMARAVSRILQALDTREAITVFGDFDADGVCSTAVLTRALRDLGGAVTPVVPHRVRDGRDLTPAMVSKLRTAGTQLIITIDCGTRAIDGVAAARAAGIDVIVVDHHVLGPQAPAAVAFVNPNRPGSRYAPADVCATMLAFKLAWALYLARGRAPMELRWAMDLVAVATIADSVALVGENRAIVKHVIKALSETTVRGLAALLIEARCANRALTVRDIGFEIVPRLNAPGRMWDAQAAVDLLLAPAGKDATALAAFAGQMNDRRRAEEEKTLAEAREMVGRTVHGPLLTVYGPKWHPGVASIVAARLAEEYGRPALALVGQGAILRGSARAPQGGVVYTLMQQLAPFLLEFGGHPGAVGFAIAATDREAFLAAAQTLAVVDDTSLDAKCLEPEAAVELNAIDAVFLEWLDRLGPFGRGHPEPIFEVTGAVVESCTAVGRYGKHLRGVLVAGDIRMTFFAPRLAEGFPPAWLGGAQVDVAAAVDVSASGPALRILAFRVAERFGHAGGGVA